MTATPPTGSALATSIIELVADTLAGRIQTVRKSRSADEPGLATARRLFVALVLPVDAFRTHARLRCVAENLAVKYPDMREVAMSYARGEFSRDFTRHHEQLLAAWESDRLQIVEWLAGAAR